QVDAALLVDLRHLHRNLIADLDDIFGLRDTFSSQLGDVYKTFLVRKNLDEGAELLDPLDGTEIDFADDDFLDDALDNLTGLLVHLFIRRSDEYLAVLLDVDLDAGLFDNLIDDLTAGTDDITDLIRIDLHRQNLRRVRRELLPRLLH